MSIIDRIAGALGYSKSMSPKAVSSTSGGYDGARSGIRGMSNFEPFATSANSSMQPTERKKLIARSRDLVRNAPIARGAVMKRAGKVVGTGITYHSRVDYDYLGMTPEQAQAWQKQAEREFRLFCRDADITRKMSESELQYLAFLTVLQSGDALVSTPRVPRPGCVYKTRIQLVEGDRISNPGGKGDTQTLIQGVEIDEWGAPIACHVCNQHPGESYLGASKKAWTRIPLFGKNTGRRTARLLMFTERPEQYRGVPLIAPLIAPLAKLDKFSDATLMNAIVSSMFTVFLQTPNGESLPGIPVPGENQDEDAPTTERNLRMGSGAILELPPGYEPKFAQPSNPNQNFDPFFLSFVRQMGMSLETPYEVLLGAYTSSYSASRAALLDAQTTWKRNRQWLIDNWNTLVLESFMDEAVEIGRLPAPGYFDDPLTRLAYLGAEWVGDAFGSLDPLKEVQAAALRVKEKFSTRAREKAEMNGTDWDDDLQQLEKEESDLRAAGLSQPAPEPGATTSPAPSQDPEDETDPEAPDDPEEQQEQGDQNQ